MIERHEDVETKVEAPGINGGLVECWINVLFADFDESLGMIIDAGMIPGGTNWATVPNFNVNYDPWN